MFDLLNVLYLGAVLANPNLRLYSDTTVPDPKMGEVVAVSFHIAGWGDDKNCKFSGVMTPWARDWEETVDNGLTQTKLAPEPDKAAGFAVVLNKKECPGKPVMALSHVANRGFAFKPHMLKEYRIDAANIQSMKEDERPKWLPQVMKTINKAAETNPEAKAFVDFTKQAAEAAKAKKEDKTAQAPMPMR